MDQAIRTTSFPGKVWRLLVDIKDALALLALLLFFVGLFTLLSARPSPGAVREGALLIELDGVVREEVSPIDPFDVILSGTLPTREFTARELVRSIDEAASDDRIKAIALDMSTFLGGGQVHLQEIGAALDRFRAADKPVLAYAAAYTDDSIALAAHASEVWVDPFGGAVVAGPGGERLYYAGLIERLGVNAHVFRVGTYKSAVEPYLLAGMSPESRANYEQLYGALWEEWQANVRRARPKADLRRVTQELPQWIAASNGDLAQAAIAAGLADRSGTRIEWGERIAKIAGEDRWDKKPGAFAHTPYETWLASVPAPRPGRRIAVITVSGEISDGMAGPGSAGAERIVGLLDDALDDEPAALVVRIDSPGGTVTGSEAIRRAILRHKARGVPVVVSMGNVAASGGYWIATPADRIFAEPETITGSIGIFGVLPTFEGALAKVGVTTDGVRTTGLSGQPDFAAGLTPDTEAMLQATVEWGYDRFLALVAQSRNISRARADELGQGRVWDGGSARQLGLVDQFGGLHAALAWAAEKAGIENGQWHADYLGAAPDRYTPLLRRLIPASDNNARGTDMFAHLARREAQVTERVIADLTGLLEVRGAQARCLECPAPALPAGRPAQPATGANSPLAILRTLLGN
jgi:protease-4